MDETEVKVAIAGSLTVTPEMAIVVVAAVEEEIVGGLNVAVAQIYLLIAVPLVPIVSVPSVPAVWLVAVDTLKYRATNPPFG